MKEDIKTTKPHKQDWVSTLATKLTSIQQPYISIPRV